MQFAFIGNNFVQSIVNRFDVYLKYLNEHSIDFVMVEEWVNNPNDCIIPLLQKYNFRILKKDEFDETHYDHIVNLSDKYFQYRLNRYNANSPNLVDKSILSEVVKNYNILAPQNYNVHNTEFFIKPKISSGAYSEDEFGYTKINLQQLEDLKKHPNFENYVVQEYLDTNECILFILMCNGSEIKIVDSCSNIFLKDDDGRPLCVYGDFTFERFDSNLRKYDSEIKRLLEMLYALGYNKICGTFNVQYSVLNDTLYLHDFNTRTGPFSVGIEKSGRFNIDYYEQSMYCFGLSTNVKPKSRSWIHYTEKDKIPLIPQHLLYNQQATMLTLNADKKSGMVREDYDVKIKLFKENL